MDEKIDLIPVEEFFKEAPPSIAKPVSIQFPFLNLELCNFNSSTSLLPI
jgi:hypothetical protein